MIDPEYKQLTEEIAAGLARMETEGQPIAIAHIELTKLCVVHSMVSLGPVDALEMLVSLTMQLREEFPKSWQQVVARVNFPEVQGNA